MARIMSARAAVGLIQNGNTVISSGFVGCGVCEELLSALENRYLETGLPRDLTFVYAAGQGDGGKRGMNHVAHEGLVRRVIGGHWGLVPRMGALAAENKIEGYCFPQGVVAHTYRNIAAGRPTITHVGLGTFVDPRFGGGRINSRTTEELVELVRIDGREWLHYRHYKPDFCFLRGTTADEHGNISLEREAITIETLAVAQAVHNSGGQVIVQVERLAKGKLNARTVVVPGIFVDIVVVADPENHWQTFAVRYDHALSGEMRVPLDTLPSVPLNERKIICRRAFMELVRGSIINFGIGMPELIANVAVEEGADEFMQATLESGLIGGVPASGLSFGVARNADAIICQPAMFDFYDGGGLDMAFLGMAETDSEGNVNVSKLGKRIVGAGGFINITQNAKRVVYCGTFTAGGLEIAVAHNRLAIKKEGRIRKFVAQTGEITFSGRQARKNAQKVLYITERAVFDLRADGLWLTEIAPGMDLQKDILSVMDFMPKIADPLLVMDERLFGEAPMGWKMPQQRGNPK